MGRRGSQRLRIRRFAEKALIAFPFHDPAPGRAMTVADKLCVEAAASEGQERLDGSSPANRDAGRADVVGKAGLEYRGDRPGADRSVCAYYIALSRVLSFRKHRKRIKHVLFSTDL